MHPSVVSRESIREAGNRLQSLAKQRQKLEQAKKQREAMQVKRRPIDSRKLLHAQDNIARDADTYQRIIAGCKQELGMLAGELQR